MHEEIYPCSKCKRKDFCQTTVAGGCTLIGCSRWFAKTAREAIMKEKELELFRKNKRKR